MLILSARRSVDDRVRGLEQGGDDYLTKPFALAELLARLRNLIKRKQFLPAPRQSVCEFLTLNWTWLRREATRSGQLLQLTPQEFVLAGVSLPQCGPRGDALDDSRSGMGLAYSAGYQRGGCSHLSLAPVRFDGPDRTSDSNTASVGYVLKDR